MEKIILEIIKIVVPLITLIVGYLTGYSIQRLKNRPQAVSHRCRIANLDVYTYFDSNNKPSKPACIFLSLDGNCQLSGECPSISINPALKEALAFHKGKCYLAQWNK